MTAKPKHNDQESPEDDEGASILQKDQHAFVDEKSPHGKQFGDGRKVADLDRVGAMTPDADSDEPAKQPQSKP